MLKDSGSTLVEIAKELGCTKSAIFQKAAELRNKAKKEKENAKMAECNDPKTVEQKIEEPEAVTPTPVEEYKEIPSKAPEISGGEEKGLRAVGNGETANT